MERIGGGALGIVLAFLGFCVIVAGIRGTYVAAYEGLKSGATPSSTPASKGSGT